MALALFLGLVTCAGALLFPVAVKVLLGGIITGRELSVAPGTWLALGAWIVVPAAACYGALILFFEIARRVSATLRTQYVAHLLAVPLQVHRQQQTGELLDRLTVSIADIEFFLRFNLLDLAVIIALLCGSPVMMFWLSWKLTLVVLMIAAAAALALAVVSHRLRQLNRASTTAAGALTALLQELLLGVDVVQAFNAQGIELDRFEQRQAALYAAQRRAARYATLPEPLAVALGVVALVVLVLCGSRLLADGELQVDTLVAFLIYVAILASQGRTLSLQFLRWHHLVNALHRLDETLALPRETDPPEARMLPPTVRGAIEFEAVAYHYPNRESAIHGLSFRIEPGECVGIVGESGAGKTTIFNLLLRFARPQSGTVRLDGLDLATVMAASLRAAIAVVPQETYLFNGTILDNVRYGRPSATDAEVREACRGAQADRFIAALPQGYRTMVGERGLQLSAGQRQRLAIARALLKDAPVLLMDEPTSALDAATEEELHAAMEAARRGRTTLIIAHRLATVAHLPRLLVMHQGQLVAEGSHEELMENCPLYRTLVSTQFYCSPLTVSSG
jgi:ABC-type multidrug transport system fused ATPase/permease subunit